MRHRIAITSSKSAIALDTFTSLSYALASPLIRHRSTPETIVLSLNPTIYFLPPLPVNVTDFLILASQIACVPLLRLIL